YDDDDTVDAPDDESVSESEAANQEANGAGDNGGDGGGDDRDDIANEDDARDGAVAVEPAVRHRGRVEQSDRR
ncbi:hypothetical protein HK405_012719, partial [Cladochytrium tenue]